MIKRKIVVLSACFAAASLFMVSCGSTKEPEPAPVEDTAEEQAEEETPAEENTDAIDSIWASVDSSRQDAIDAGAENAAADLFAAAEVEYNKLKNGQATEEELLALKARYAALKSLADAKAKKEKIDQLGLASYNQKVYDEGCALIGELDKNEGLSAADWNTKAVAADASMTAVLETGLRAKAREERNAAVAAQKQANSVKCFVSRKDEYASFVDAFKSGDKSFVTKNPEAALENYTKTKEGYEGLYTEVSEARAKAQQVIDEAKQRVAASEKTAEQADIDKPLGDEPVEGIEAEDTKLLEEDDYTESASAEVDLTAEEAPSADVVEQIEDGVKSVVNAQEAE